MTHTLDLDAYFERIGWGGAATATFETLAGLLRAHMASVPFENLDPLLGRRVRLDAQGLQAKLVTARRGGYCFEHATLLGAVLDRLGFHPVRHSARVTVLVARSQAPRTHMFLTVQLKEDTFVLDPGFGALAARVPVPLQQGAEARHEHERHWMVREGNDWVLRVQAGDKVVDAWVSSLEEDHPIDFEMGNHYVSTHPDSSFVNRLMLRALTADGRVTVMNRDVTTICGATARTEQLADRASLRVLLRERFGFDLPEVMHLRIPSVPEWAGGER